MSVDHRLLEKPSVKEAVLAVGKKHAASEPEFRYKAILMAMNWEWFEATYAISFHRAWEPLGLDRNAMCAGPHTVRH